MTFERALTVLCFAMMLAGAALRFTALDEKLYNNDEATTSMHVSGHTLAEYSARAFDARAHPIDDLLAYQRPDPARGPLAVVASLAAEDPQHPPLYYLAQYAWERAFGSSLAAHRAVAAIFGALAIGAGVWFGFELGGTLAGFICGALVAVSPFALLYSQEAREYSLWLLLAFASSALWLRALREPSARVLALYAFVSALGLYTDLLYVIVSAAQALALAFAARDARRAAAGIGIALGAALLAASPWLYVAAVAYGHGVVTNNAYLSARLPLRLFALKWIFNTGALFYDLDYLRPKTAVLLAPGFAALVAAVVTCARGLRTRPVLALLFALGGVALLALVVPDLIEGESRSTSARYLVPLWAALYGMLGVALAQATRSSRPASRALALTFVALTACTGIVSFVVSTRHETWWIDGSVRPIGPIARAVAATGRPVVVWRATWGRDAKPGDRWDFSTIMLADELARLAANDPHALDARFVQIPRDLPFSLPNDGGADLVLDPTQAVRDAARAQGATLVLAAGGALTEPAASADLAKARDEAARARAARGIVDFVPSLWRVKR